MKKSKATSSQVFIFGSSSVLSRSLSDIFDNCIFFGRTNPYSFEDWFEIETLATNDGIKQSTQVLARNIEKSRKEYELHLILLQGVSSSNWEESLKINLISVAELAETFAARLTKNSRHGSITMIGSAAATLGGKPQYASTKAALVGLMNSLNSNYSEHIRTNLILPGVFKGKMVSDWDEYKIKKVSLKTYANRFAEPAEIVDAIRFVIENDYVSGSVINMTNGQVK